MKEQIKTSAFWFGLIGMGMLQTSTIPQTLKILGGDCDVSNLSVQMFVQTWVGLALYLYNAVKTRQLLYIVSNTLGLIANSSVIIAILLMKG